MHAIARAALRSTHSRLRSPWLLPHRLLSQEARAKIQSAIDAKPIVVFMKGDLQTPQCGFSGAVARVLDSQGVPPEKISTYNVLDDAELRSGIKEFSDWPTVPQVYVAGEFIGGCDIVLGMHQSGDLEALLKDRNIIPKDPPAKEKQSQDPS